MFLAEIDSTQMSVLSAISTTETEIQLVSSGVAVLQTPSAPLIDGQMLKVLVCGQAHWDGTTNLDITVKLYSGSSLADGNKHLLISDDAGTNSTSQTHNFYIETNLVWSSAASEFVSRYFADGGSGTIGAKSASTQNDLKFFITGVSNNNSSSASLTISEFKLELM